MSRTQACGEARRSRRRRRHRADHQVARRPLIERSELLLQHLAVVQHALRRGEHLLPFRREPFVLAAAANDGDAELGLERAQSVRQRRLRDVASLRRPAEVPMLLERREVAHRLEQIHAARHFMMQEP